jgi:hypothetical protein
VTNKELAKKVDELTVKLDMLLDIFERAALITPPAGNEAKPPFVPPTEEVKP